MKTFDADNETKFKEYSNGTASHEVTSLLQESTKSLVLNNIKLTKPYGTVQSSLLNCKIPSYEKVLQNIEQDLRSQSMPDSLENSKTSIDPINNCDTKKQLLPANYEHDCSPATSPEKWFNTWPERFKSDALNTRNCDNSVDITKFTNRVTFNEALQNISIAYSPVTKKLHLLSESKTNIVDVQDEDHNKKNEHSHAEASSVSSTVSSLTDHSPSGSLLDSDDRLSMLSNDTDYQCYSEKSKKSFSSFFNRNMFQWKQNSTLGGWKFFKSSDDDNCPKSPIHEGIVASSSALIQHIRPSNLPAKTSEEDERHRKEYKAIIAAAKKKEAKKTAAKQKQQKLQLQQEEQLAAATRHFTIVVLPNWETMCNTRKTNELWWHGLPSSVRGKVWQMAIGNELNLTQNLYEICLQRAQHRLNSPELSNISDLDQESSMDVIQLDISRTFPNLCIFQEGGPYSDILHSLLAAYVCYRPDVGYVQGMSFIAAILILNMHEIDAFLCFANLLNRPLHLAAFTLNQVQMQAYYNAYNEIFNYNLSKLHNHFLKSGLTPDLYLLDWIYTIFAKAMPLDVACRVWDVFLRDGDEFLFRTALGILHLHQDLLMDMDFLHGAQFLTRLPEDLSADQLFKSIQVVTTSIGKQNFSQIVERCKATDL